jgi:hypothetical protein
MLLFAVLLVLSFVPALRGPRAWRLALRWTLRGAAVYGVLVFALGAVGSPGVH